MNNNQISCLIKDEKSIEDKSFYIIQENVSKKEHIIPKNQIHTFKNIKLLENYFFLKEYNQNHQKTYLSIIHPEFMIGQEKKMKISDKIEIDGRLFFELESVFTEKLTVAVLKGQENSKDILCKVVGYRSGKPKLHNIETNNSRWNIGSISNFKIHDFSQFTDKKGIFNDSVILKIPESNDKIEIRIQHWQNSLYWKFNDINCKIIGILSNGLPKLITFDSRHPHYTIGETYDFTVCDFLEKTSVKGYNFKVINLIDDHNKKYQVHALPNQENKIEKGELLKCKVDNINTQVHLKQINSKDPYFYEFHEIIPEKNLKTKYFLKYLALEDEFNLKLKSQYEQQSGFWVFTYCNYILTKIKYEESNRKNLSEVLNIIELHNRIENWILTSGILKAIHDDNERKLTKLKTIRLIDNNNLERSAIESILNFNVDEFYKKGLNEANFAQLYYLIKHSDFENIDEIKLLQFLSNLDNTDKENKYIIKKIIIFINKSLEIYKNSLKQEYFILSKVLKSNQKKEIIKYVNWIYVQIRLSNIANLIEESNILTCKFYRYNTLLTNNKFNNEKLLLNAFYITSNLSDKHYIPIKLNNTNVEIVFDELGDNPNKIDDITLLENFYKTKIVGKHYKGFKATIGKINGFLPFQNITDVNLKQYKQENLDWETSIDITLYCSKFQYFICKQPELLSEKYYSKNLKIDEKLEVGTVIYGIVKNVTRFDFYNSGVFLSTEYGDGLIYQDEVNINPYDYYDLKNIFLKGDRIPVYVLNHNKINLDLGFKQLVGTIYEVDYYDIINNFNIDIDENLQEEEYNYNFQIELEKGFIFEQFAFFQESIDEKIKYIKFAKAFFSNTKNARSFLLNIYIEYFNSLKYLDYLIEEYTFEKYNEYRNFIVKIKDKIQIKTLENFPESKNLLFFIDILLIFNSKEENDLEEVFTLVKKSIQENDIILKAVAKTVLSNNLILTEIEENDEISLNDYTLKNLKRIREYINQGVLSVEESVEDKLEIELKQKRTYWLKKINEDEGEKLEFKATFLTPIPNNDQDRIITSLEKQLIKTEDEENRNKIKLKIDNLKQFNKTTKNIDKIIIHSALKTICAFSNTNGGYLLLGVSDDKKIFGLEQDYNSFKNDKNRDGFGKYFDSMIKEYFGDSFSSSLLEKEFLKFPEGDILIVNVKKSSEEIFILKDENGAKSECIYVRNLSSTNQLKGIELSKFLKNKFRDQLKI